MYRAAILGAITLLLFACSSTPTLVEFTEELRADSGVEPEKLKELQYYVSQPVVLNRDFTGPADAKVTKGHGLLVTKDRRIEQVKVLPLTPGVAEGVNDGSLDISFEAGHTLRFGTGQPRSGSYKLLANKWQGDVGSLFIMPASSGRRLAQVAKLHCL